jgi:CHAD domain-containing protein
MDDGPALQVDVPVGEALRAVARDILAQARAAIAEPASSDAEAVHDFRRAMKRWRALLRLFEPFVGAQAKQLRDEARDLARALSGARNAQSALDALADLEHNGLALPSRSIGGLRRRIEQIRNQAQTTLINAAMRAQLGNALERAQAMVERWPLELVSYDALADQLARFYRRMRRMVPADWSAADAEELHELRKRVVIHRYQMDIVRPLWPRFAKMWTGEAQRLRERLGHHQDGLMLESLTAAHQPLARWRSRLAPAIAARRAEHVAAAARLAARLLVEKPGTFRRRLAAMWETRRQSGATPAHSQRRPMRGRAP